MATSAERLKLRAVREAPFTYLMFGLCVLTFAAEVLAGGNWGLLFGAGRIGPVIAAGAMIPYFIAQGELWRFITAGFIHFSIIHLAFNSFALLYAGPWCERRFGTLRFATIYLVALVFGNLAAYLTTINSDAISAGASGAIMGAFAAMGLIAWRFSSQRQWFQSAVIPIALTLFNGFVNVGVSNAAHVGGLLGGLAAAWAIGPPQAWVQETRRAEALALESARVAEASFVPLPDAIENDPANQLVLRPTRSIGPGRVVLAAGLFALGAVVGAAARNWFLFAGSAAFVLLAVVGLLRGRPPEVTVTLSPRGFTIKGRRERTVLWTDVEEFGVAAMATAYTRHKVMTYRLTPTAAERLSAARKSRLATGAHHSLVPLGMSVEDQARLFETWREKWVAVASNRRTLEEPPYSSPSPMATEPEATPR